MDGYASSVRLRRDDGRVEDLVTTSVTSAWAI